MADNNPEIPAPSAVAAMAMNVYARAKQAVMSIPACENLSQLLYGLVEVLQLYSDHKVLADNQNAEHMMHEMKEQLEMAMRGIDRVCQMPGMYRSLNALRITTEFRNFCHSLGLTLEGLHSMLSESRDPGTQALFEEMKQLEWAFRTAQFPLEERDLTLYKELRRICSMSYGGELSVSDSLDQVQSALENAFGESKLKDNWRQVSKQLFQDLDTARIRRDHVEQHSTRLLLCALSQTVKAPPEFVCPLTMEVMEDPVVLLETGVTVERRNLEMWLYAQGSRSCPVSGAPLSDIRFAENKALRALIDDWRCENAAHERSSGGLVRDSANSFSCPTLPWAGVQGNGSEEGFAQGPNDPPSDGSGPDRRNPWVPTEQLDGIFSGGEEGDEPNRTGGFHGRSLLKFKDSFKSRSGGRITNTQDEVSKEDGSPPRFSDFASIADTMLVAESTVTDMSRIMRRRRVNVREVQKEMFTSCSDGDLEAVMEAFENGASLDATDEGGWTCLHWAAVKGHLEITNFVLDKYADGINVQTEGDRTSALYLAAYGGHTKVAALLLENGTDIEAPNKFGWTPLHAAADQGHSEVCELILDRSDSMGIESYYTPTEAGWTALHHACRHGHLDTAVALVKHMSDVNRRCEEGWTALHVAVDNCHIEVVEMLLKKSNANANIQSRVKGDKAERAGGGWTALHAAQDKNLVDIGKLLLEYGADPDIQGADGATALHRACFMGNTEFAVLLVTNGKANLNKKMYKSGRKAIQVASDNNHTELYNFLYWQGLQRRLKTNLRSFKFI